MKTVLIFRHAKSDWSSESSDDHARPLASRGRKAAKVMGRFLRRIDQMPDAVVSSSAARAATTVTLAAKAGKWKCPIRLVEKLYACAPDDILSEIRSQPDSVETLLVAAHEPACSETIALFIGGARVRFPTAAIARLELPATTWADSAFGHAQLIWLVTPAVVEDLV